MGKKARRKAEKRLERKRGHAAAKDTPPEQPTTFDLSLSLTAEEWGLLGVVLQKATVEVPLMGFMQNIIDKFNHKTIAFQQFVKAQQAQKAAPEAPQGTAPAPAPVSVPEAASNGNKK